MNDMVDSNPKSQYLNRKKTPTTKPKTVDSFCYIYLNFKYLCLLRGCRLEFGILSGGIR